MEQDLHTFDIGPENRALKERLLAEGFPDWSRKDYRSFIASLERHGRYNLDEILKDMKKETAKEVDEVKRYYVAFWTYYQRITEWKKVIERIEKGEKKFFQLRQIRDAVQEKVERHLEDTFGEYYWETKEGKKRSKDMPSATELLLYSWPKMRINYGGSKGNWSYQEEEDAFLVCMMHRHGYGAAERIRMEIRRAWQFRFNWYFKSRNTQEIQKRCDTLVRMIERENEEVRKKEAAQLKPSAAAAAAVAAAK